MEDGQIAEIFFDYSVIFQRGLWRFETIESSEEV
jgi:hypothetical protein